MIRAEELVPYAFRSQHTWTLETPDGRLLVKQVIGDPAAAMSFERRARAAGIAMPNPVGEVVDVDGIGRVSAHEWVDGRPLADEDDIAEWLGHTLAILHGLQPLERADPEWYGLHPEDQWQSWLAEGERQGRPWAPILRRHLPDVLAASARIETAFRQAGDYVFTHRDVEPWNVLMTADGPMLLDWDTAGPDSAGLEAAQVALVFAMRGSDRPDAGSAGRTLAAYESRGGRRPQGFALARRAGVRLSRLTWRLRMSLGEHPIGSEPRAQLETRAGEQVAGLASFVDLLLNGPRNAAH